MAATANRPVMETGAAQARRPVDYVWAIARISLGWIFLWAFLDKTFGWGFATPANRAWIAGGSPTDRLPQGHRRERARRLLRRPRRAGLGRLAVHDSACSASAPR